MKKLLAFTLLLSCFLSSCNHDRFNYKEEYELDFYPRKVSCIWIAPGTILTNTYTDKNGKTYTGYNYGGIDEGKSMRISKLFLSVCTSNSAPKSYREYFVNDDSERDTAIPSLEEQIEADYRSKTKVTRSSDLVDANLICMEYRTTGIKSLNITADKTLCGQTAGSSLNDFLEIVHYEPDYICGTNKLVLYGKEDTDKPTDIASWLQLSPMAQPAMYLKFKSTPTELPADVCFTVTMVTDDNKTLTYTMPSISLTK